jgi:hypothetical protein
MTCVDATTTVVALAGILGTLGGALGGPWLGGWLASRTAQRAAIREQRVGLYVEALRRARMAQDLVRDPTYGAKEVYPSDPPDLSFLTEGDFDARMDLFADTKVQNAWHGLLSNFRIHSDAIERSAPAWIVAETWRQTYAAIVQLQQSCREAVGVERPSKRRESWIYSAWDHSVARVIKRRKATVA